jgi:hypothetical protein
LALVDPNNQHGGLLQADRLVLVGDYQTRGEYLITQLNVQGTSAEFQLNRQAFRRDFSQWWAANPAPNVVDANAFSAAFAPNRLMRLQNQQGFKFFVAITGSGVGADGLAQVTFANNPLPVNSACVGGFMDNAKAAPLSMISYGLAQAAAPNAAITGNDVQLIRSELNPVLTANPLNPAQAPVLLNTPRVLLDFVVNFDVDFVIDARNRLVANAPPCLELFNDGVAVTPPGCAAVGWSPERVRTMIVTLSARTPEQDARFTWLAPVAGQTLISRYQFVNNRPGAARVRTLRAEILVPNLAQAGR